MTKFKKINQKKSEKVHNIGYYWLYGRHSVVAALKNKKRDYMSLILTEESRDYVLTCGIDLNHDKIPCEVVTYGEIGKLTKLPTYTTHQGIALKTALLIQPSIYDVTTASCSKKYSTILMLDKVNDPHNIGAIIRTAAAFEVDAVITTFDGVPEENGTIVKAACGAFESIPFIKVVNLKRCIDELKEDNYWILGLDVAGKGEIGKQKLNYDKIALVLGSEEKGLRRLIVESCDVLLRIPVSDKVVESLNVSNAAAIGLYETYKREN
ncbi:23S rRNA (guanosine2251-2'-O)-methyltransferase [Alphaproteobacteria bacterium]